MNNFEQQAWKTIQWHYYRFATTLLICGDDHPTTTALYAILDIIEQMLDVRREQDQEIYDEDFACDQGQVEEDWRDCEYHWRTCKWLRTRAEVNRVMCGPKSVVARRSSELYWEFFICATAPPWATLGEREIFEGRSRR